MQHVLEGKLQESDVGLRQVCGVCPFYCGQNYGVFEEGFDAT